MKPSIKNLKYIAYIRRSEVREDRQVLSLPAQRKKIKEQFPDLHIVFREEKRSAFTPGRPVYGQILEDIKEGNAQGIIAWHPNRLSRNELDSAALTYLLRGPLKDLKFCTYNFDNSAEGIMMLQMIMNQSQYESSKQGRDVKRGMEQKASNGEKPGRVPPGYQKIPKLDAGGNVMIRAKDNKVVTETGKDPERYDDVKRMWTMLLSGSYTPNQIWKIAVWEWGFTTPKTTKTGGGPLPKSGIYRIFTNPFYAGYITHNGLMYKGKYEPMVTWQEFQTVQQILGSRGNHRVGTFEYAFNGMIRCGVCNCSVVARHVTKFVKATNKYQTYVYYYCSRRSLKRPCNQSKYTLVEDVERDIDEELSKYTIIPEFKDLALKVLRRNHKLEVKDRERIYIKLQKRRNNLQSEMDSLIGYLHRELLDEDEYKRRRNQLKVEIDEADNELRSVEKRADDWLKLSENAFNFAVYARAHFKNGDVRTKRDILRTLGESLVLKDNKLYIEPQKWLVPIGESYPDIYREYIKVRTNKKATAKELDEAMVSIFELWRAQWDSNPRHPA